MRTLLYICTLFTVGCTLIRPVSIITPEGKRGYSMRCGHLGGSIKECYQKAGELCPLGYTFIGYDHSKSDTTDTYIYSQSHSNFTIQCKP